MRIRIHVRWLASLLVALFLATGGLPVHAAPAQQGTVTIVIFSYVDVASPGDPTAACNLQFDTEDETYATSNPLGAHTFILRDPGGTEIGRQLTDALATLQRARFDNVAELESYTLQLEAPPAGWALCPQEQATRTLTQLDFSLGRARATYHFYQAGQGTPPPTGEVPTATTAPPVGTTAVPTQTPIVPATTRPPATPGGVPTARPTAKPGGGTSGGTGGDASTGGQAGAAAVGVAGTSTGASAPRVGSCVISPPPGTGALAMIRGVAFVDNNADGVLGADEPGLNDVEVYLHGGGLELSQITPARGSFSFEALGAGEYSVFINPGPEWRITTPAHCMVRVSGNIVTGVDFGLIRADQVPAAPVAMAIERVRLPATGVIDLPRGAMLGGLALALSALGLAGLTVERWRGRRRDDR
jgi:hypothetical protein